MRLRSPSIYLAYLASIVTLTGCGKESAPKPTPQDAAITTPAPVPRSGESASLGDALSFITVRLTGFVTVPPVKIWEPAGAKLSNSSWVWQERTVSTFPAPLGGSTETEEYRVVPNQLSTPVTVKANAVTFECYSEKCITVTGTLVSNVGGGPEVQRAIQDQRAKNTWYFQSPEDAERVANAMNHALKLIGAKPRAF